MPTVALAQKELQELESTEPFVDIQNPFKYLIYLPFKHYNIWIKLP